MGADQMMKPAYPVAEEKVGLSAARPAELAANSARFGVGIRRVITSFLGVVNFWVL
jgi:hypothetical protein